jgi:hypothetical protein
VIEQARGNVKAKKRKSTGPVALPLPAVISWCYVYRRQGKWLRRYFLAISRQAAETFLSERHLSRYKGTLWTRKDLDARDEEANDNAKLLTQEELAALWAKQVAMTPVENSAKRQAARTQYAALKRAYAAGLTLWWVKRAVLDQLEAFKPRRVVGQIYLGNPRESKDTGRRTMPCGRRDYRGDTSPGWDNAVKAYEESR